MSNKGGVPDAWDDDWVNVADKPEPQPAQPEPAAKLTKAQRRAQHAEQQRQLWDTAENPGRNLWLETQGVVPLKQEFKPQVTLLSRKPPTIAKRLEDDEDSEDEARKKREADFEERQRKAKVEREEKQRRYAEARERIMGSSNNASPAPNSRDSSHGRDGRRQRGNKAPASRRSQPDSPAEPSPTQGQASNDSKLFDPDDMGRRLQTTREANHSPREDQPLRQPRGPDNTGRGGFGFASRGQQAGT